MILITEFDVSPLSTRVFYSYLVSQKKYHDFESQNFGLGAVSKKKSGQKSDIVWLKGGGGGPAPMPCLTFFLKKLKII